MVLDRPHDACCDAAWATGHGFELRAGSELRPEWCALSRTSDDHGRQPEPSGDDQPNEWCTDVRRSTRLDTEPAWRHRVPADRRWYSDTDASTGDTDT